MKNKKQNQPKLKSVKTAKANEIDLARVKQLDNEATKNCVLIGSILINLFVLTAFMWAVADSTSAYAIAKLIVNL